jgi:FdrA protein
LLLLSGICGPVWSNTPLDDAFDIGNPWTSREHTVIDLGDDVFTRGRPHPMIDLSLRNERLVQEAADDGVAVLLLDVVLGYGAHPDPAAELVPAIRASREMAARNEREIVFVASVCGTALDPQGLERQESALREAGVLLADSNAGAARLAAGIAGRRRSEAVGAERDVIR